LVPSSVLIPVRRLFGAREQLLRGRHGWATSRISPQ
jgi:hypothetical protein